MIIAHHHITIADPSHAGEARRAASRLAQKLTFSETRAGELSIVVMELANNVLTHAKSGEMVLVGWNVAQCSGIDVFALDRGPGIEDVHRTLKDGYSTSGTPGNGLGAVIRLSSGFDMYSNRSQGTALFARILSKQPSLASEAAVELGCLVVPIRGEVECGDTLSVHKAGRRCIAMVVDGLGHGSGAAEVGEVAIPIFQENAEKPPERILHRLHAALRPTRGGVVGIAEINLDTRKLRYCGVGNVSGSIISNQKSQSLVSHNGTVGHVIGRTSEFEYDFPPHAMLVMHSDGLTSQWSLEKYAGLRQKHPGLIASVLYRDFKRGRDDSSILVIRESREAAAA